MTLVEQIVAVYPQLADPSQALTYLVQDNGDGAFIAQWNHQTLPRPTQEQLNAAQPNQLIWRTPVMADYRERREVYLSRLAGIAIFEGSADPLVRQAASTFRQRLLDIPSDLTVTGATTQSGLNAAIYTLYKAAVAEAKSTAPAAAAAFDKISK